MQVQGAYPAAGYSPRNSKGNSRGKPQSGMGTWDHQQADKWVGRFLVLLAKKGHTPGFRYGKDLYLDLIEFFQVVSRAIGVSTLEVAVGVAIRDLTRRED